MTRGREVVRNVEHVMRHPMWIAALWGVGCVPQATDEQPEADTPLDMILVQDGLTYAGAATVDITPQGFDTWNDDNGSGDWDGCMDRQDCADSFNDVNGNGRFDPVWIGGFGPLRPATGVHDPITARAVVLAEDEQYFALVSTDLVGLHNLRIAVAKDALEADGFLRDHLVVTSSHNHQGPDTLGLWGNPFIGLPGFTEDYQELVTAGIEQAVREAAADMKQIDLKVAAVAMRDRSPFFNAAEWGGKNRGDKVLGLVYDGRDPVVVSDQLLALQGVGTDGVVFTLTIWSGHPEVWSSGNTLLSSDWPGVTRDVLEDKFGGVAIHLPESLGGMQSALHAEIPLVEEDGTHQFEICAAEHVADENDADCFGEAAGSVRVDADGDAVPRYAEKYTWEYVRSHGWHIAEAAADALAGGEVISLSPLRVEKELLYFPIESEIYNLLGPLEVFDLPLDSAVMDTDLCPEAKDWALGCLDAPTWRIQLGEVGLTGVPGELLPELAWGLPEEDPRWTAEQALSARGAGAVYFPQQDADCVTAVDTFAACANEFEVGGCDCRSLHAWPYRLSDDAALTVPLLDRWDTRYRAVLGNADTYLSYILPEPDWNSRVSVFEDDGDHYEDTVSPSGVFGQRLLEAQARIHERW